MDHGDDELLIRFNPTGTHAAVERARPGSSPSGAHRLLPGTSYFGIPYDLWIQWEGRTVDVLHLQEIARRTREPRPAVPIAGRLAAEGWRAETSPEDLVLPPVATSDYGFSTGSRLIECSRAQLVAQCVGAPETPRVWTPAAHALVPPEEVPFLVEALVTQRRRSAENGIVAAFAAVEALALLTAGEGLHSGWAMMLAFAAAWLAATLQQYVRLRRAGPELFSQAREEFRHDIWIGSRRATHTEVMLAVLLAVFVVESSRVSDAVTAAGLVKERVREGEMWRLLTGPLLHGNLIHLAMNGLALWSLGPLVEAHSRRAFVSLLFLLTAVSGSVASLVLIPDATSVGASGGILGIAGYLLVLAYRRRRALPHGYAQRLTAGILATAVLGIVGYSWVDNATHLGGFLAGLLLGIIFGNREAETNGSFARSVRVAGELALAILVGAGLWAVLRIRSV